MKNLQRFYSFGIAVFALGAFTTSCGLSDELDKINSINAIEAQGSFSANIVNNTMLLKDLIPTDQLDLKVSDNGTYSLAFENSNNYKIANADFPSFSKSVNSIPLSVLNLSSDYNSTANGSYFAMDPVGVTFDVPKPEIGNSDISPDFKIKEVTLKQGAKITLNLGINNCNTNIKVAITIPSLTKNGTAYSNIFSPANGNSQFVMGDLDGYTLSTDPNIVLQVAFLVKKNTTPVTGDISPSFTVDIGNNTQSVKGFFGETNIAMDPIEVPVSLSDLIKSNNNGQMVIKEATLSIGINQNGFTIPTDLDFSSGNLCYYKGNSNGQAINLTKLSSDNPNTYKFKITNINVLNIEKLVLNPKIILNKGLTSGENIITDNSSIDYNVNAEVPFDFTVQNLVFEQGADNPFKDLSLDTNDYQILDGKVMVKGKIDSELPLSAALQVYYQNQKDDNTYLEPLFDTPVVINPNSNSFSVIITKDKLDKIKNYPYQSIQMTLNGDGAIKSTQKINFKVGVALKGKVKAKV